MEFDALGALIAPTESPFFLPAMMLRSLCLVACCLLLPHGVSSAQAEDKKKKSPFNGRMITLSDFGAEDLGYLSLPQQAPIGGLVILPNQWGLNTRVKKLADQFAKQGYVTVAVDLYNGAQPTKKGEADRLMKEMRAETAVNTAHAGARLLKDSPKFRVPYVGLVGIGIGGSVALEAAKKDRDELIDALAMIEGPLSTDERTVRGVRVPTLAIFAEGNASIPPETFTQFERYLKDRHRGSQIVLLRAAPGFSEPTSPSYNRGQDQRAFNAVSSFMPAYLNKPPPEPSIIDKAKDKFESIFD